MLLAILESLLYLLMSEAPGGFREWDGSLADNLRRNSFEANSVDTATRQQHLTEVLFESRHVDSFAR